MSSFIAILTWRSYRWKNPSFGPLVLLCSAFRAVVTALVYSLTPKDLYGTIMPTCYTNMTKEIWNFGKARVTLSYRRASCVSVGVETNAVRHVINRSRSVKRRERSSTGCTKRYFAKFRPRRGSWRVRYVTNGSSLGTSTIVIYARARDVHDWVGKHIHYTSSYYFILLSSYFVTLYWIISYNSFLHRNFLTLYINFIFITKLLGLFYYIIWY